MDSSGIPRNVPCPKKPGPLPDVLRLTKTDVFFDSWQAAGFRPVAHLVFPKRYASSSGFVQYQHEQAFLLAKGDVALPDKLPSDVVDWLWTGNRLHPTQKFAKMLQPLVDAFCNPGASSSTRSAGRARHWLQLLTADETTLASSWRTGIARPLSFVWLARPTAVALLVAETRAERVKRSVDDVLCRNSNALLRVR
jgi:hypothetical protein